MFTRGPTYDKIKFRVPLPGAKLTRAQQRVELKALCSPPTNNTSKTKNQKNGKVLVVIVII